VLLHCYPNLSTCDSGFRSIATATGVAREVGAQALLDVALPNDHNILVMKNRPVNSRRAGRSARPRVASAEFKTRCLELLDHVRESGATYIVTKHGRPVAQVVPYREPGTKSGFGALSGTVLAYDRPFDPVDGEYDINRD
jgi:prevent-host-death family protein